MGRPPDTEVTSFEGMLPLRHSPICWNVSISFRHHRRQDPTNLLSLAGGWESYLACAIGIVACRNGHTAA